MCGSSLAFGLTFHEGRRPVWHHVDVSIDEEGGGRAAGARRHRSLRRPRGSEDASCRTRVPGVSFIFLVMNTDTSFGWILALIVVAALLVFLVIRGRDRPSRREEQERAPPSPRRKKRKRAPAKSPGLPANGAGPERAARGAHVASVEVIPGKLIVNVFAHTLDAPSGPVPCWSYVSEGFWPLGQKEIVFTVMRREGEARDAYPRDLLELYAVVHQLASEGRLVDVGHVTTLGGTGLLGRRSFLGVLYTPPQILRDVYVGAPWLMALILTAGEIAVAQQQGVVRIMAMLGKHYRYFPTAPWIDRDREELCSPDSMAASIVARSPRLSLYAASVRLESQAVSWEERTGPGVLVERTFTFAPGKQRIVLRLHPRAAAPLKKAMTDLPADSVLTLLVGPDPGAPTCLAWEPGQQQPFAISIPSVEGEHLAGNFITFLPQQEEDGGIMLEDGFAVFLRDESWQRIRAALVGGEPISLPVASGEKMGLEIIWLPELDPDFVNPLESHVPGGWAMFGGNMATSKTVFMKSISLLTIENVLERRVASKPLSAYIKAITEGVESCLKHAKAGSGQDLALECEVRPDGGRSFGFSVRPGEADDELEGLRERLMELPPPPVVGPIRFQLNIQLRGGSGMKKTTELN